MKQLFIICYFCFTDLFKRFELIDPAVSSIVNIGTLFFVFFIVKCSTFAILGDWLEALYSVYIYLNWLSIELLAVNVFMVVVLLSPSFKQLAKLLLRSFSNVYSAIVGHVLLQRKCMKTSLCPKELTV